MKLINVDSLDIEEFFGKTPPYAILSHTWGDEEVTYQEWRDVRCNIIHKAGYKKILGARAKARKEGIRYLWCDTSCIDKTNSAELSEAINSMFAWYRTSQVCYAYLADVPPLSLSEILSSDSHAFGRSRWFTRGWTLQELIAPPKVLFYAQDWTLIGPSTELASSIAKVCHIDETVFTSKTTLQSYSIANRMSWAAGRQTSRVEDEAYCLLGIFDIHMPLLYGEGPNAFRRLQEEIMKVNTDLSILVWTLPAEDDDFHNKEGWLPILAPSPAAFKHSGTIVPTERVVESTMSNRGLSLNMPLIRSSVPDLCYGLLPCWDRAQSDARGIMDGIWIPLSISRSNLSTGRYLFRPRVSTTWMCLSTIDATYHALRCASPVWIVENRFTQQYETLHPDFIDAAVESVPAPGRAAVMFLAPDYPGPNAFGWSGAYDYNLNNKWTCEPRLVTTIIARFTIEYSESGSPTAVRGDLIQASEEEWAGWKEGKPVHTREAGSPKGLELVEQGQGVRYLGQRESYNPARGRLARARSLVGDTVKPRAAFPMAWFGGREPFMECSFRMVGDPPSAPGTWPPRWYIPIVIDWFEEEDIAKLSRSRMSDYWSSWKDRFTT